MGPRPRCPVQQAMYTVVAAFVGARVIDVVQEAAYSARAVFIISDREPEIAKEIIEGVEALSGSWFAPLQPAVRNSYVERSKTRIAIFPFQEDRVPIEQLPLEWPTVPSMHPEEPTLNILLQVLSANRSSILDKAMCIDERLAGKCGG